MSPVSCVYNNAFNDLEMKPVAANIKLISCLTSMIGGSKFRRCGIVGKNNERRSFGPIADLKVNIDGYIPPILFANNNKRH